MCGPVTILQCVQERLVAVSCMVGSTCMRALSRTDTRAPALCVYVCVAPGNCDASTSVGTYYRKHNPLISFDSVRNNATRCAKIVNSDQLDKDLAGAVLCALCRLHFMWPATHPFSVLCLVFLMLPGCLHH